MTALKYELLLLLMSHYVRVNCEDACQEKKYGKAPHPTSCAKYYVCNNYIGKEKTCPPGEHYSVQSKGCIPIRQSGCGITTTHKTTRRAQPTRPFVPGYNLGPAYGSGSGHVGRPNCTPNVANLDKFIKLDHMGTTYYTSKAHLTSDVESAYMCRSICGHITEIEDSKKDKLVHDLLKRLNFEGVLIAGTNKYDYAKWENERTSTKLKYFNWCLGEPNQYMKNEKESCMIYIKSLACMYDAPCAFNYAPADYHYLCEVNQQ